MCCSWGKKLREGSIPNSRQLGARHALLVLFFINLFNYADRYVTSAISTGANSIQNGTDHITGSGANGTVSDGELTYPGLAMTLVYMFCSTIFGYVNDMEMVDRRHLLCAAIILWSIATVLGGLAKSITELIAYRGLVGVGEAAFVTVAPVMMTDYYPVRDRNVLFGFYSLAIPIGGALGFGIGTVMKSLFGFRSAFFVCGFPGVVVALLMLTINDPKIGINDEKKKDDGGNVGVGLKGAFFSEIWSILSNPHWLCCTIGQVANSFALGGIIQWYSGYLEQIYPKETLGGLALSGSAIIGGIGGTILGALLVERLLHKMKSAAFFVAGVFQIIGAGFLLLAINFPLLGGFYTNIGLLILCQIFQYMNTAPISAATLNVVAPHLRARSSGLAIFFMHSLGDMISPLIVGSIADPKGDLGALAPLGPALQICWVAMFVAGGIWILGYIFLSPLPTNASAIDAHAPVSASRISISMDGAMNDQEKPTTYYGLLCAKEEIPKIAEAEMKVNPVVGKVYL